MSTSPRGGGLVPVRLAEVPLHLRLRAAEGLARRTDSALAVGNAGVGGLLARLSERQVGRDPQDARAIRAAASSPSPRVYWIRRQAYEEAASSWDAS